MIFNLHTVAELEEFITYKDKLLEQYQIQFDAIPLGVPGRDAWAADFATLKGNYARAKGLAAPKMIAAHAAVAATKLLPVGKITLDIIAVEPEWLNVTHSLQPNATETPGDATDLYRRLALMGGKIDETRFPQPVAPDVDLKIFQAADAAAKKIEEAAEKTKDTATSPLVIGGLFIAGALGLALYAGWKPLAPKQVLVKQLSEKELDNMHPGTGNNEHDFDE